MSADSNKKVGKKTARVPVIMQMEALECGAACLTMILAYFGCWRPLEQVRRDCGISRDGSNAKNILKAARSYGLTAQGYRYEPEYLRENGVFPCIIHWNFNHFVVLKGIRGNKVYINDPARGSVVMPFEEFDKGFTGICIVCEPSEDFIPGGKKKSILGFAKKRMEGTGTAMAFVALTALIMSFASMIRSGFTRVFLDQILPGNQPEWLVPFMLGMGLLAVVQITVSWINALYALKIKGLVQGRFRCYAGHTQGNKGSGRTYPQPFQRVSFL